ncbi:MAG: helix-turn-helix domain-containing protein [Anaerolineae bacterium]|nr:helix-turn-helix domain-containing protein [Gloeobacterales cyanobacterium ES-bin-313]
MTADNLPSTLQAIGDLLSKGRQAKGLSLEDVAETTRIPMRYLVAIESGNVAHLPEPVYVRAFIRKFGDLVDLDGQSLVKDLQPDPAPTPTPVAQARVASKSMDSKEALIPRPYQLYLFYGALVIVGVVGLSYLQRQTGSSEPDNTVIATNKNSTPSTPAVTTAVPVVPVAKASTPGTIVLRNNGTAIATTLPPGTPLQVNMNVEEPSWVRITTDGQVAFEGDLRQGTKHSWQAKQLLKVRTGNAGGVMITLNNQPLGKMGKSGQVVEREFRQAK